MEKIFGMKPEKGRWIFVIAGLIINICLGAIYSYSVIAVPLRKYFETDLGLKVTATEMQMPFIVFLVVFAITMPLMGRYIEKYGPKKVAIIGGILTGLGWFLASFANSPLSLVFLYGIAGGIGVGIAYNCPIPTSARWFPDRRGLAVGLTILGFGFSATITAPLADLLTASFGVLNMLRILGILFLIIIIIFALFLRFPPADWKPAGFQPKAAASVSVVELTRGEMVKTKTFYGLWLCYTIGCLSGLMAIGVSKSVGLEIAKNAGISEVEITAILTGLVSVFAVCNGFGRPLFGWITDRLRPMRTAVLSFILIFLASVLCYLNPASIPAYTVAFCIFWLNLGGWLAIAPTSTAQFFGMKDYARNYGLMFTAYGAGAVSGNLLVGQVKDILGAYIAVFPYIMALAILGIIIAALTLKPPAPKQVSA